MTGIPGLIPQVEKSGVGGCKRFRRTYGACKNGGYTFPWNDGNLLQHHKVSQSRSPQSTSSMCCFVTEISGNQLYVCGIFIVVTYHFSHPGSRQPVRLRYYKKYPQGSTYIFSILAKGNLYLIYTKFWLARALFFRFDSIWVFHVIVSPLTPVSLNIFDSQNRNEEACIQAVLQTSMAVRVNLCFQYSPDIIYKHAETARKESNKACIYAYAEINLSPC